MFDAFHETPRVLDVPMRIGSLATSSCISCKHRVETVTLGETLQKREIPRCARCSARDAARTGRKRASSKVTGIYKASLLVQRVVIPADSSYHLQPDITFFHEPVSRGFHTQIAKDAPLADLLIVIGTSLLIPPVKEIPGASSLIG